MCVSSEHCPPLDIVLTEKTREFNLEKKVCFTIVKQL